MSVSVSRPLPCGSPGTFQHLGSSLNKQKDADRFVPVLGHLKNAKDTQVARFLRVLSKVAWHEKLFIKNNSLRSKSRNFMLWLVIFVSGFVRCRCSTTVVVTGAPFICAKCMLTHISCHTLYLHFGLHFSWYLKFRDSDIEYDLNKMLLAFYIFSPRPSEVPNSDHCLYH